VLKKKSVKEKVEENLYYCGEEEKERDKHLRVGCNPQGCGEGPNNLWFVVVVTTFILCGSYK